MISSEATKNARNARLQLKSYIEKSNLYVKQQMQQVQNAIQSETETAALETTIGELGLAACASDVKEKVPCMKDRIKAKLESFFGGMKDGTSDFSYGYIQCASLRLATSGDNVYQPEFSDDSGTPLTAGSDEQMFK